MTLMLMSSLRHLAWITLWVPMMALQVAYATGMMVSVPGSEWPWSRLSNANHVVNNNNKVGESLSWHHERSM